MARIRHLSNSVSKSLFIKTATKTNSKNIIPTVYQGGFRL